MKIIRNNVCYVELDDILFLGSLPQTVFCELKVYYSKDVKFEKFTKKESVNFFKQTEYIIDYDSIKDMSCAKLEYKIKEIKNKLNNLAGKWLNGSQSERKKLDMDKEYTTLINGLKYMLKTLKDYKSNKNIYDNEINKIFNNKQKRL